MRKARQIWKKVNIASTGEKIKKITGKSLKTPVPTRYEPKQNFILFSFAFYLSEHCPVTPKAQVYGHRFSRNFRKFLLLRRNSEFFTKNLRFFMIFLRENKIVFWVHIRFKLGGITFMTRWQISLDWDEKYLTRSQTFSG